MLAFLLFVAGVLVVGGLLFLGASLLLGRGETQPPAELDRSPVELPDDRPVVGDDVRALQISVAFRGYRMSEVDWLLDQFAQALDERDAEIALLRAGGGPVATQPEENRPEERAEEMRPEGRAQVPPDDAADGPVTDPGGDAVNPAPNGTDDPAGSGGDHRAGTPSGPSEEHADA